MKVKNFTVRKSGEANERGEILQKESSHVRKKWLRIISFSSRYSKLTFFLSNSEKKDFYFLDFNSSPLLPFINGANFEMEKFFEKGSRPRLCFWRQNTLFKDRQQRKVNFILNLFHFWEVYFTVDKQFWFTHRLALFMLIALPCLWLSMRDIHF